MVYALAVLMHTGVDQLIPQLLMKRLDAFPSLNRTLDICMKKFDYIK